MGLFYFVLVFAFLLFQLTKKQNCCKSNLSKGDVRRKKRTRGNKNFDSKAEIDLEDGRCCFPEPTTNLKNESIKVLRHSDHIYLVNN